MNIKTKQKVILVELKEPLQGQSHFYFGSKVALTEVLGKDVIGIGIHALNNVNLLSREFENKKCIIRQGRLITLGEAKRIGKINKE